MKIVDGNLSALANAVAGAGKTQDGGQAQSARPGAAPAGQDTADVSGLAGTLAESASAGSAARSAKVEALRSAVEAGKYQADSASIARGVVSDGLVSGSEGDG